MNLHSDTQRGSASAPPDHPAPGPDHARYELVIVAYRSRPLVEAMLDRLPQGLPVVVVDNSHDCDGLRAATARRAGVRYVDGPGTGFAAGANAGAFSSAYDTVLFVNPDSSPTVDDFEAIVSQLDPGSGLVAVSAVTASPGGTMEIGSGGWEPTVGRAIVHAVGAHKIFPTAGLWARPTAGRPIDVDWLCGACMAVDRRAFVHLGGFDASYFVYNEDVAFGRQIRLGGLRQVMRTDVVVPHLGGGSGGNPARMTQQRAASLVQYVSRHNSRAAVALIRLALTMGSAGRYVAFRLLRRDVVAAGHLAYLRGLWTGAPRWSG